MPLVGIVGTKGSGKTTVARQLPYQRLSFASPLKESVRAIFGFNDAQLYGDQKETTDPHWNVTPRRVLQVIGTELFRDELPKHIEFPQSIWIMSMERRLDNCNNEAVIDDVRFVDEAKMIKSRGGLLIRLERGDDAKDQHASELEQAQIPADVVIHNNGPLHQTVRRVQDAILKHL